RHGNCPILARDQRSVATGLQRHVTRQQERPSYPPQQPHDGEDRPKGVPAENRTETPAFEIGNLGPVERCDRLPEITEISSNLDPFAGARQRAGFVDVEHRVDVPLARNSSLDHDLELIVPPNLKAGRLNRGYAVDIGFDAGHRTAW